MRRLAAVMVAGLAVAACAGDDEPAAGRGATTTGAATSEATTASTAEGEAGDLRVLAQRIVARHPDPFHHLDRAEFESRVRDDPADPDRLLVAAMTLANLGTGEGHGGVYPWAQPDLEAWSIHLYDFGADGFRVVGGEAEPVGSRLVAVGDAPIEEVAAAVRPLVPHDNEATVRSRLPGYLAFPAVLRGLGFDPAELTWQRPDGTTETTPAPAPITSAAFGQLLGLFQAQVPPSLPYDRDRMFWSEVRGRALYVRWNQAQHIDRVSATPVTELATAMVEQVESGAVDRVVVDARHNPGGETSATAPLALGITEIERSRPGTVRFLVGRSTFSAATNLIARLRADVDVTLVGEPTGGSASSYGDPSRVSLPGSGIVAFVDTEMYESGDGGWGPLEPDIAVDVTWADHAAGRDPALDAALS